MSGPQPGTATPWVVDGPDWLGDYNIQWKHGVDTDTDHLAIAAVVSNLRPADDVAANAAAIVHRMNNWDAVVDALETARNCLANGDAESGYCMCGDPVESHWIGSGHSPVDSHTYFAGQVVEQIDAALTLAKSGGNS